MIRTELQPDQDCLRWDDHVSVYEAVFEPFSSAFASVAIASLELKSGTRCLDVGCGSGAAALLLASQGVQVDAIDASSGMVARVRARAQQTGTSIQAHVMDGQALQFADATFDAALSVFGAILFPDAVAGLREMRRVVKPGGRVSVVTWTEPQNYELASELRAAAAAIRPDQAPSALPAQLRFRERADFLLLHQQAGFDTVAMELQTAVLRAPSSRWLAEHLAFAPGIAAILDGFGDDRSRVLEAFVAGLERTHGSGPVALKGTAFVGTATVK